MDHYQETFSTWNKIALLYQDRFMDLDIYNESYNLFCDRFNTPNARVMEVGCGPGNITKYLLSKRPDFIIHGIDISPNMIELAKANCPGATFEVMDCRNIFQLNEKFNGIVCGFCLPYLSEDDGTKFISDCKNLLEEGGIFYLSFVAGDVAKSGFQTGSSGDRIYFYFHPLERILKQLSSNGLEVLQIINVDFKKSNGDKEVHTIVISEKL